MPHRSEEGIVAGSTAFVLFIVFFPLAPYFFSIAASTINAIAITVVAILGGVKIVGYLRQNQFFIKVFGKSKFGRALKKQFNKDSLVIFIRLFSCETTFSLI